MKRRLLSILMALALVLGLAAPVGAAEKAAVIRLTKTTGTVKISKSSGKTLSLLTNMRLYNGYHVTTAKGSYAWLNLDDAKLLKEDAASEVEVRQSGKKLEVKVWSGSVFFNVTEKLADDESLNISTSTMIVGIRGTSGYVQVVDRWTTLLTVLEGTVECSVSDPVTGQIKTEEIHGGETVKCVVYPQDQPGDKCDILRDKLTTGGIPGFVLTELVRDIPLCDKIQEATGVDIPRDLATVAGGDPSGRQPDGETATPEVLGEAERQEELDESTLQEKLDEVAASQGGQGGNVSGDKALPKQPTGGGGFAGGSGGGGTAPTSKSGTMPLTDVEVQALLDGANSVTVQANTDAANTDADKNTLKIENGLNVAAGKTLTLDPGIGVTVEAGKALQVDGTMVVSDNITNNGAVTVTSSNTLRVGGDFTNKSTLTVTDTGKVVVDGTLKWSEYGSLKLTPGATVMAKNKGSGTLPPDWAWSAEADASGYYTLVYTDPYLMPLTAAQVQALLDKEDNVTIKANADASQNTLTIDSKLTVAAGKTLTLEPGIDITMESSKNITIDGTMTADSIDNQSATVAVTDGGSLRLRGDYTNHSGILKVSATGQVVVDGILTIGSTGATSLQATRGDTVRAKTVYGSYWGTYWHWSDADASGYRTFAYAPPPFSVTFDADGGTIPSTGSGTSVVTTGADGVIPLADWPADPTRADYVFVGWYTGRALGNGTERKSDYAFTVDTTLYAHWRPARCNITFDANGGTFQSNSDPNLKQIIAHTDESGKVIDWPADPTNGSFTFEGWYFGTGANAAKAEQSHVFTSDITVYAHWSGYSYDEATKTLTVTGDIVVQNYTSTDTPWNSYTQTVEKVIIADGTAGIGNSAFRNCTSLTAVVIPDSVTSIGEHAFQNCTSLANVTIPDSVTSIDDFAFRGTALTSVTIPNKVPDIGAYTFSGCGSLASVTIPDSVTSIGQGAFNGCANLTSITIPNSVTEIQYEAFLDCTGLTSVVIPNSVTLLDSSAFKGCTNLASVTLPNQIKTIRGSTFRNCAALTSITIPNSVTEIVNYAFQGCSKLASVEISPNSKLTGIGDEVFAYCTALTDITIPDGVTSIGTKAFYTSGLSSIAISESSSLKSIGNYAFGYAHLTSITIPAGVTEIGNDAFQACNNIVINFKGTEAEWNALSVANLPNGATVNCTDGTIPDTP